MNRHERRAAKRKPHNVAVDIDPSPALEKLRKSGGTACVEFRDRLTVVGWKNGCLVLSDIRMKDKATGEVRDLTHDDELMLWTRMNKGLDFSGTEFVLTLAEDQTPLTQADVENILLQIEGGRVMNAFNNAK